MHCDKLARASDKAVAFETALVSLNREEETVHGKTRNSLVLFVGSASRLLASINALGTIWTEGWPACWTLGLTLTDIKMAR